MKLGYIEGVSPLVDVCSVCSRAIWGEAQRLGFAKWRHDTCYPGSQPWIEYVEGLTESERTNEMRLIYESRRKKTETKAETVTE